MTTKVIATKNVYNAEGDLLAKEGWHLEVISIEGNGYVWVNNDAPWKDEDDRVDKFVLQPEDWKTQDYDIALYDYEGNLIGSTAGPVISRPPCVFQKSSHS